MKLTQPISIGEIISYAEKKGLKNVEIKRFHPIHPIQNQKESNYYLSGEGKDAEGWPLVWEVAKELGIWCGSGFHNACQIRFEQDIEIEFQMGEKNK